ncbi:hypothetical protein TNCV_2416791 [Trichonephila clavipes]|nr:hypothetical protein TNCV_2416791 [Trichonephila clavipes]
MAYLAKGNKPDLLSVCEEMGVEVDQSSKLVVIKILILNSKFYVEEEVKIILDRVNEKKGQKEVNEKKGQKVNEKKGQKVNEKKGQKEVNEKKGKGKSEWLERPDNTN